MRMRMPTQRVCRWKAKASAALLVGTAALFASDCRRAGAPPPPASQSGAAAPAHRARAPANAAAGAPSIKVRNVELHVTDPIALEIRALEGRIVSNRRGEPPVFDDKRSFTLRIESAEIAMTSRSLTDLLNTWVFAYPGAPLEDVRVRVENGGLVQSGRLAKGAGLPFEIRANVSLRPDGKMRVHPVSIRVAGVGVRGLLDFLGLELASVLKLSGERGVTADGDDLILDPERLLPPPAIAGRVTSVRLENDRVVQIFGSGRTPAAGGGAGNFMAFRGGRLRFGKLTMDDTDMVISDDDPSDPFVFFLDHYNDQLVAGFSKNTPEKGLRVHMPDFDDLGARSRPTAPATSSRPSHP